MDIPTCTKMARGRDLYFYQGRHGEKGPAGPHELGSGTDSCPTLHPDLASGAAGPDDPPTLPADSDSLPFPSWSYFMLILPQVGVQGIFFFLREQRLQ